MSWFKRIFFFSLVNIAMIVMVQIIMHIFGVEPYLNAYGMNYQSLAIFCLIWGSVSSFISLMMSKWMAKKMMGVQLVDERGQYADLVNMVHSLARAANLPKMPEVGIYQSPEVNAFATGPSKSDSLVAVSTGLLQRMNREEIEGVLAHEVSHVANGDMVTMALVQGVVNAFTMFLARIAAFALQNVLRSDDEEGGAGGVSYFLSVIVFDILFGILGAMVVAWFSRLREYRADAGAARLAGRGPMVSALQRLQAEFGQDRFVKQDEAMAAFKISSKPTGVRALLSTHPSLEDRIARLQSGKF